MLLKDPAIVILDEATSHLDSENEALVQQALADGAGRAARRLVIAHRLSTITTADQILVLDEGASSSGARHDDLLAAGGLYADLYRTLVAATPTRRADADDAARRLGPETARGRVRREDQAMSSLRPSSAGLADDRGAGRLAPPRRAASGSIGPCAEVLVAVAAGAGLVLRVVAVDEVDAAGDGQDALDGVDQLLAGGVGVAGVEAEADAGVADVVPQPGDRVEVAGHGVVAAGGVLEVDGHLGLELRRAPCASARSPASRSSSAVTWPPWTMTAGAPISAAASQVCCRILRDGMRILLLGDATLTRYGACT